MSAGEGAARVRAAVPADRDALVEFARAMARETEDRELDLPTLRAGVAALLADASRGRVLVVESDGRPVATLMLTYEWSDWRNGTFWWIQSVYVDPAHRRRGLYRLLHEHVRALARQAPDVCGLRLYVERDNVTAQKAYREMGMDETYYLMFEEEIRRGPAQAPRSRS